MQAQSRKYIFRKGVKEQLLKAFKEHGVPVDYKLFVHWAFNPNLFVMNDFLSSKGVLDEYYINLSKDAKKTPSELSSVGDELADFLFIISFIFLYYKYNHK